MLIKEAIQTREGAAYVAGTAVLGLITVLTLVNTVTSYKAQWKLRDAVLDFEQGKRTARKKLGALRSADKGDRDSRATVRVMLGAYNYQRSHKDPELLNTAEKLFDEALSVDPERTSAAVGMICVRLAKAEVKARDARVRDAKQAESELDRLVGSGAAIPDVEYLRGATLLLQGRADKAIKKLDDDSPSEAPSREGQAARFWNLGVAKLLDQRPDAYQAFALGYMLRPVRIPSEFEPKKSEPKDKKDDAPPDRRGEAPKILETTYRVCLNLKSSNSEELKARCDDVVRYLHGFSRGASALGKGQLGRFAPHRTRNHVLRNALGLANFKAGDFDAAATQFGKASSAVRGREPLYVLNLARALLSQAQEFEAKDAKRRKETLAKAAKAFEDVCVMLDKRKGREGTIRQARTNAAVTRGLYGDHKQAYEVYKRYITNDPNKADVQRDLGALADRAGRKGLALRHYRKAIGLAHPDADSLADRVGALEAGQ
jgi:tetratricopeptide (TPR) repeat protein